VIWLFSIYGGWENDFTVLATTTGSTGILGASAAKSYREEISRHFLSVKVIRVIDEAEMIFLGV